MKAKEIRDLSVTEIEKRLRDTREESLKLRLGRQTGQVEKTHEIRERRKTIARLETVLNQKKKAAAATSAS
ncbi:MAG: 50S ribosomal protein L29 [Opitutaceae bacterium]|nr:50S ribosomal protein L29 [Opitutaceae bacterium]